VCDVAKSVNDKFRRLFILQCILLGIILMTFIVAFIQQPKEVFPFILFVIPMAVFWLTYFYMTYYLGTHGLIEYSQFMLIQYIQIPLLFSKQTKHLPQKYTLHIFVGSLLFLVLYSSWLELHP